MSDRRWGTALYTGKYLNYTYGRQFHTPPMPTHYSAEDVSLPFCSDQQLCKSFLKKGAGLHPAKQNTHWPVKASQTKSEGQSNQTHRYLFQVKDAGVFLQGVKSELLNILYGTTMFFQLFYFKQGQGSFVWWAQQECRLQK